MDFFKLLKIWVRNGLLWYAVVSLCLLVAGSATGVGANILKTDSFLLFLPFGLCMSAAGMLFSSPRISRWLRLLGHYAITVVSFLLFILLPNLNGLKGSFVLILVVLLTALYWLLFGIVHLFKAKIKKLLEE